MVIWLIGLSGSGKTTLGREISAQLREHAPNTVLLDGDEVRKLFSHDSTENAYTLEGRRLNASRLTALCELLDRQEIHVICCILSLFPEMRAGNTQRFSSYFEIFMDAPMEVLEARDPKGLYAAYRRGDIRNIVGLDIPFPEPTDADMVIDTSGAADDLAQLASGILKKAGLLA